MLLIIQASASASEVHALNDREICYIISVHIASVSPATIVLHWPRRREGKEGSIHVLKLVYPLVVLRSICERT